MAYLKPQSPLQHKDGDYFYPLTTVDQVVMEDGSRLNSVFKHTVRKNITLSVDAWSNDAPFTQTITLDESVDDLKVDANVAYSGDASVDAGLNKAAACLNYIKKNGKDVTFVCLTSKPEVDLPIDIVYESLNGIATVGTSEPIYLDDELTAQAELIGELQKALQGKMGKGVLDFSIVGGASQPTNPEENTIWVQTDDEENIVIEKWSFGAEEPANPIDNMVWIITGTSSTVKFDAIKENDIQLYPISVKQYISDAWVNKEAKSYQDNEWIDLAVPILWLYNDGDQCIDVTGGWTTSGYTEYIYPYKAQINTDNIKLTFVSLENVGGIGTTNKIDISDFKYLHVEGSGDCTVYVASGKNTYESNNVIASAQFTNNASLDISGIDTTGYITVTTNSTAYVYKVWLER